VNLSFTTQSAPPSSRAAADASSAEPADQQTRETGIPFPQKIGGSAASADEAVGAARELGGALWVV